MFDGIIIGDSYGAGFEFKNAMLVYNDGKKYYDHPTHMASDRSGNSLKAGMYTDDTQMSIAVAETLLGDDFSKEAFAENFVKCFKRDPRKGYASGFYHFLMEQTDGASFIKNIKPHSEKNGAAMRSVPLGLLPNVSSIKKVAEIQASLTHNTEHGINSSIIVGLMAYFFAHDVAPKDELTDWIKSFYKDYPFEKTWTKPVPCHGISTALAVHTVLMSTNSMNETLIKSVAFGGDTDSVASIACGIQSLNKNKINDISENLIDNCEQGNYGYDYCMNLDKQLKEKFIK